MKRPCVSVDGDVRKLSDTETLVIMDLSTTESMIATICELLKIDMRNVLFIWASPPCNTYSKMGTVNVSRGCHYRQHNDPEWPPRQDNSKYSQQAVRDDRMNINLTRSLLTCRREHGVHFAIENPSGGLSRRPFMISDEMVNSTRLRGINYCAYGHRFMKPTDIWTSNMHWKPVGTTGNGKCGSRCTSGAINSATGVFKHKNVLGGDFERGPKGRGIVMQKSAVPQLLLQEILASVAFSNNDANRKIVIDLFAGQGSLRNVVMEQGLEYIGVDIRDFM
jgi:hypothetical protein